MAAHTKSQRFLRFILPSGVFESLEAGTRTFALVCPCGHTRDLWEAGGVKFAGNEGWTGSRCPACRESTLHKKRKKTDTERLAEFEAGTRERVFLSSHAWWATALVFGVGAMIWSLPMFLVGMVKEAWAIALVSLGSLILGFGAPLLWMTTRYRITDTELKVYSGPFHSTLDLCRIKEVSKTRKGLGLSFAFDTDFLWVGYPGKLGGVLISPKERKLFLLALAAGCPHLELKGGELVAS